MSKIGSLLSLPAASLVRESKSGLWGQTLRGYTVLRRASRKPKPTSPFLNAVRLPKISNHHAVPSMRRLLQWSSPSAVARLVPTFPINSINSSALWGLPHILKESKETVTPTGTNSNASRSVHIKFGVLGIMTPSLHAHPYSIRTCVRHAVLFHYQLLRGQDRSKVT